MDMELSKPRPSLVPIVHLLVVAVKLANRGHVSSSSSPWRVGAATSLSLQGSLSFAAVLRDLSLARLSRYVREIGSPACAKKRGIPFAFFEPDIMSSVQITPGVGACMRRGTTPVPITTLFGALICFSRCAAGLVITKVNMAEDCMKTGVSSPVGLYECCVQEKTNQLVDWKLCAKGPNAYGKPSYHM